MANQPSPEEIKKLLDQAEGIVDPNEPNMSAISPLQRAELVGRVAPQAPVAAPVPVAKPLVPVITPDDGGPLEDEESKPVVDPINVTGSVAGLPPSRLDELRKLVESSRSNRTSSNLLADSGQILDKYYSTLGGIKDNATLYTGMRGTAEGDLKDAQTQLQTATLNSTPAPSDFSVEGGANDGKNVYMSKDGKTFITDDKGAIVPYTPKAGEKMVKMAKTMTDWSKGQSEDRLGLAKTKLGMVGQGTVDLVSSASKTLQDIRELESLADKVSSGFKGKDLVMAEAAKTTDISGKEARNLMLLGEILADYIQSKSGKAVSDEERKSLMRIMPTVQDRPEAYAAKLKGVKTSLVRIINERLKAEANNNKDVSKLRASVENDLGAPMDQIGIVTPSTPSKIPQPGGPGRLEYLKAKAAGKENEWLSQQKNKKN